MTEQEEFEFRARAEAEAAAQQEAPTTFKGSMSEVNKAIGRGLLATPLAAGEQLAKGIPQMPSTMPLAAALQMQPNEDVTAFRKRLLERLKPTPANKTEQMLGTGVELGTSMLPFAGGPGTIPQKLAGLAAPTLGGVAGEQIAQDIGTNPEQGKMLGTMAAPVGMALAGKALSPRVPDDLKKLLDAGAMPTPGQQTQGFLKKTERLPLWNQVTASAEVRATDSASLAATNIALEPIKGRVKVGGVEGFAHADQQARAAYDEVLNQLPPIRYTSTVNQELLKQMRSTPADARAQAVDVFRTSVASKIESGRIDPHTMKEIDSELGRIASEYRRDPAVASQHTATAIFNLQATLRQAVRNQNPAQAPALDAANAAWNNLVRVGDAVARASATNGHFTPEQFAASVKHVDTTLNNRAFKTGSATMQDTAQSLIKYMGNARVPSIPYSAVSAGVRGVGTAGGVAAGLGGAAAMGGAGLAVPLGAGAAAFGSMYTPIGQRAAQSVISGQRPMIAQTLGDLMRDAPSYAPATLPIFTRGEQ